jgi:hypothetical protein
MRLTHGSFKRRVDEPSEVTSQSVPGFELIFLEQITQYLLAIAMTEQEEKFSLTDNN